MGKATSEIGERGVLKVIDELLARGLSPYRPVVDDGVDIMLSSGLRIQVKTANLTCHGRSKNGELRYRAYAFSPEGVRFTQQVPNKPTFTWTQRKKSSQVDFYVLVGLNENRFWIVASKHLSRMHRVKIGAKIVRFRHHGDREADWTAIRSGEDNWDLLRAAIRREPDSFNPDIQELSKFYFKEEDTIASFAGVN